jgi:VWFA-related protein
VLLVSEGPEYEQVQRRRSGASDQWSMNDGIQRAVQALNRANAVVYAIDPRGVSTGNPAQIESSSTIAGAGTSAIRAETVLAFGVLQAVAANTGGIAMPWRPDMRDGYRRIVEADGSYYIVGYVVPQANRGAYHRITVQMRRRAVQVRARSGYFLPQ